MEKQPTREQMLIIKGTEHTEEFQKEAISEEDRMITLGDAIAGKLSEAYETGLEHKSIAIPLKTIEILHLIKETGYLPRATIPSKGVK